jgi:hypothetical protein
MRGWPVGGHLPQVPDDELGRMTARERADYHIDRMRVFSARGMLCAWIAVVAAVAAVVLAVGSLLLH